MTGQVNGYRRVKNNPGDAFFVAEGQGSVVQICEVIRKKYNVPL
jgi:uncharacterized cupin superfamily protein